MKKLLHLPLMALIALFLFSCSNKGNKGTGEVTKLVNKIAFVYTEDGVVETSYLEFKYDNQKRIVEIIATKPYDDGDDIEKRSVEYIGNTIKTTLDNGVTLTYTLNDDGYLIKLEVADAGFNKTTEYEYENGYLSKETTDRGGEMTYTWQNGNLVAFELDSKYTFTYSGKVNKLNIGDDDTPLFSNFLRFKGMNSNNHMTSGSSDGVERDTYTYTFDNDGYPTQVIYTYVGDEDSSGFTESRTYTYY